MDTQKATAGNEERFYELAHRLSQDLQTPVRHLHTFTQLLLQQIAAEEGSAAGKHVESIRICSEKIQTIIERITLYACLEEEIDHSREGALMAIIQGSVQGFQGHLAEGQTILIKKPLPQFLINRFALNTILNELITNALQANRKLGSPLVIQIAVHTLAMDIAIEVTDNGVGVKPQNLTKVLNPLFEGRPSRRTDKPSAGMGLSICKQICSIMGWKFQFESAPNIETRCRITIPYIKLAR